MTIETVPMLFLVVSLAPGLVGGGGRRSDPTPASPARTDDDRDEDDDEKSTSLADVPVVVKEAIRRIAGSSRIHEVEKATRAGVTTYEAEYRVDGVEHSVRVSAAGEVVLVEKEVSPASLPADVLAAVRRRFPSGAIREAQAVHVGGAAAPTYYEIDVKDGGRKHELDVRPSGEIIEDNR